MKALIGRYSNRNRIQVWFALILFTICAWWTLNPLQLHLLDGMSVTIAMFTGAVIDFSFPFNSAAGVSEIVFLLLIIAMPFILYVYFSKVGARYMASATFFWFAYAAQNCFRFFNATTYRTPALIMFILSLLLLVVGLLKCLYNSEIDATVGFKIESEEADTDQAEEDS
ncbi:MAG: hypothetical protein ACD_39C01609G0001 [uncultured bacterium]|nr:MAG: hypothetical protein ACD_39C01609G0001 [uncultured bacterium]